MSVGRTLVSAGLGLRAAQDYDEVQAQRAESQSARDHAALARQYGIRGMAARDSLVDEQTAEAKAGLEDRRAQRSRQSFYQRRAAEGATLDDLAKEAQQRGDMKAMTEFRNTLRTIEQEGLRDVVVAALSGADGPQLEKIYNSAGTGRVDPGSVQIDQKTGIVTYSTNGQPSQLNAGKMAELLGLVKPRYDVVSAGSAIAKDGEITDVNTAGVEAKSEARLEEIDRAGEQRQAAARQRAGAGGGRTTALERNLQVLVDAGVATDRADAYAKLKTSATEPEEKAVRSLMGQLAKSPGYMGRGGREKALRDATEMVRTMRTNGGGRAEPGPAPAPNPAGARFGNAEDVRSAFRAGQIDRATAVRELRQFGLY